MGLSFISEGAIPYAAGHPLQVIPSCIVGSALAGAHYNENTAESEKRIDENGLDTLKSL